MGDLSPMAGCVAKPKTSRFLAMLARRMVSLVAKSPQSGSAWQTGAKLLNVAEVLASSQRSNSRDNV